MLIKDFHLTYCTNIHPGEDWETTFESLKKYIPGVKKEVAGSKKLGIGLRLSNKASEELGLESVLYDFKDWLQANDVYVFTMNGFPYGNFHGERVKDKVHQPDWTTHERLEYTSRLFKQLNYLLPTGISGGISTSPVSYKHWFNSESELIKAKEIGAENMLTVAMQLFQIEEKTGNYLHLDIEPEPDGIIENSEEVLDFFNNHLIPKGIKKFKKEYGFSDEKATILIKRYLTVCYDVCHFALAYEEPQDSFAKFRTNGIRIGKIQISAALKILFCDSEQREIWESLEKFNEPTYLHQVTELIDGKVVTYQDLPLVLDNRKSANELRAHFHVPIFLEKFSNLYSTQDQILKVISYLLQNNICEHLEIETYTWDVLPKELKRPLSESIIREIKWLKNQLI
ncbi:metabolite traffic protein EboE [Croceitalea rosinachiae]|uniref:Metabolite traffic protein EboE n=1 Tax=Croceitalea rosinachiae TaxID=3075596 RepID=A0ABU3AE84_9FLAO|nr:metabolite traffic protein EboE [Croceitalea sp. F388]MDT0608502.1 metabolite traffic protein EboE [Croceitalea sp. F388]